jgi:hypothetical protein
LIHTHTVLIVSSLRKRLLPESLSNTTSTWNASPSPRSFYLGHLTW